MLAAAEAAGVAQACCEMAARYAKDRVAFGRVIGQFQAVKHHCANMLVNQQLAEAAGWDAASRSDQEMSAASARLAGLLLAVPAAVENAKLNIQVHGGIGFTWEHDARPVPAAGERASRPGEPPRRDGELARRPVRRPIRGSRGRVAPGSRRRTGASGRVRRALSGGDPSERVTLLVDEGYLFPHWPRPWGRDAGPVEQLAIEQQLRGTPTQAHLGPTWWILPIVLPTVMAHGTADQQERWIRPTLEGATRWCQLFSEPGAGSDLAALATRAARASGGWIVNGQKVWTSNARDADLGLRARPHEL